MIATVTDVRPMSSRTCLVTLDLQNSAFSFQAGQAVLIGVPGQTRRWTYSIACSPEHASACRRIELLVALAPGVPVMSCPLQPGTTLDVDGPVGGCTLPAPLAHRRVLFVAGGTGIAPVRSLIHHARRRYRSIAFVLLYSARCAEELAFLDEWRALVAAGLLDLHATITRADGACDDPARRLCTRHFESALADRLDTLCFVYGPSSLVSDSVVALLALGVPRGAIRTESWLAATMGRHAADGCTARLDR